MQNIQFKVNPKSFNSDTAFVAHISAINNEDELFNQLAKGLKFPDYFGYNWNAVSECLRDFHWIEKRKIVLVHDECPSLSKHELSIYLKVLFNAIQNWGPNDEHSFIAIFPESSEDVLKALI